MPPVRVTPNEDVRQNLENKDFAQEVAPYYVFAVCQRGAEPALKSRLMEPRGPYRLAFSRPGLLTFKVLPTRDSAPASEGCEKVELPRNWLIRLSGHALGQLRGQQASQLAKEVADLAGGEWDALHVFARDEALPGERGFEPALSSPLVDAVSEVCRPCFPGIDPNSGICELGSKVLDIILVEPDHWLVGWHRAGEIYECWPGGCFPVTKPSLMVSRAYLKMAEALTWSQLPIRSGDAIVEIGSSPGGASQRLLDVGLNVTGVDPAEMDGLLLQHPRFEHWRNKSSAIKRKRYAKFKWLVADANVAPNYTLDAVEDIVQYPTTRLQGLLLTVKLSSYELADEMDSYLQRIRGWGFEHVKVRQLASNRRECCIAARR